VTVFSRILPLIIILILISSSVSFIYETGNDPGVRVNPESYIPHNSVALAFIKSSGFNILIFHTNNESAVIFQITQITQSVIIPPLVNANASAVVSKAYCYESVPVYSIKVSGNNETVKGLLMNNIGITDNKISFASPIPGVIIAGNLSAIICSIRASNEHGTDNLLTDINLSAEFSFAYYLNSTLIDKISGNATDGILTAQILMKNIGSAVDLAIGLQFILGHNFIVLPRFNSVILITSLENGFIFLQYNIIKTAFSMEGAVT
jgi:hypothetical protein